MFSDDLTAKAERLLALSRETGLRIATAESCTGGLIAGYLTQIPGSSDMLTHGVITYSDDEKHRLLGVPRALLDFYGAVSGPVAMAMASGALAGSTAQVALSVTGIAGPGGGSETKPVGLVYFGVAHPQGVYQQRQEFSGDRQSIRLAAVDHGLSLLIETLSRQKT